MLDDRVDNVTRSLRGLKIGGGMTAKQAVEAWDAGGVLSSIEMGGLGPGYEQVIQILAIESLRGALAEEERLNAALVFEQFTAIRDAVIDKIDSGLGGCSGAQVGAATHIAWRAYLSGWGGMLKEAEEGGADRAIMISKTFPKAP